MTLPGHQPDAPDRREHHRDGLPGRHAQGLVDPEVVDTLAGVEHDRPAMDELGRGKERRSLGKLLKKYGIDPNKPDPTTI